MFLRALSRVSSTLFSSDPCNETAPKESNATDNNSLVIPPGTPSTDRDNNNALSALALPEILELIGLHLERPSLLSCMLVSRSFYHALGPVLWSTVVIIFKPPPSERIQSQRGTYPRNQRGFRTGTRITRQQIPGQWTTSAAQEARLRYDTKFALLLSQLTKNVHRVRELRIHFERTKSNLHHSEDSDEEHHQDSQDGDADEIYDDHNEDEDGDGDGNDDYDNDTEDEVEAEGMVTEILLKVRGILQMKDLDRLRSLTVNGFDKRICIPLYFVVDAGLFLPAATVASIGHQSSIRTTALSRRFKGLQRLELSMIEDMPPLLQVQDVLRACPLLEDLKIERDNGVPRPRDLLPSSSLSGPGNNDSELNVADANIDTDTSRLKRLHFRGMFWPHNAFLGLARRCPRLVSLTLIGQSGIPLLWTIDTVQGLVDLCPGLIEIHINPGYGSSFSEAMSTLLIESLPLLKVFRIPHCDFGESTFNAMMKTTPIKISTLASTSTSTGTTSRISERRLISQLEELDVSFTRRPGLSNEWLTHLMRYAFNLRILNASGITLSPWQFVVAPHPQQSTVGDQVALSSPSPPSSVSKSLPHVPTGWSCHRLEKISIGFATLHVNQRQCQAIYGTLSQLTRLRQIHILPNHFPLTFEAGLGQLSTLRELTHLDIHGSSNVPSIAGSERSIMSEEVIQWMAQAWPKLETLRFYVSPPKWQAHATLRRWLIRAGRGDVLVRVD
ncbi:hypothetical protein BGZ83_005644 [Gryganskiella cystojenkinii]|nr:hypothetical protein BGZ83_005644 [Gryganskiella cystojenkinii]